MNFSRIRDALFSARTMTGANGVTFYALPFDRVEPLLRTKAGANATAAFK